MKTTQASLAKKWGVSRSLVCKYVAKGMPVHETRAESWLWENVPCNKIHQGFEAAISAPKARAPVADINGTGKFSRKETRDIVARLREFIADGAGKSTHPEHQTFCDGVRILSDFGVL